MKPILEPLMKTALVWNEEHVSYRDLARRARVGSRRLGALDERVAVFSENRPEWIYAAYAIWAAGRTLVPVDFMSAPEEVAYILDDCAPGTVFCSAKTRPVLSQALGRARHRPRVLDLAELATPPSDSDGNQEPPPIVVEEAQLAAIVYTSGTTGDPKGVMLTFGNVLANITAVANEGYYVSDSRALLLLPLHHVLPLAGSMVAPLWAGATIVFATSLAGADLLATLRKNRVTTIVGVPRFYDLLHRSIRERIEASRVGRALFELADRAGSRAFSRLLFGSVHRKLGGAIRHLICGGAALSPETARTFHVLGFAMCEGYGMTECSPIITFPRLGKIKLGSCGQALPGTEVRIEDGEIVTRGPNLMRGYYGRPKETAEVLKDGWLQTGDLGRLDDEGYLYVTGRRKEIIVLPSGKNVNPATVERALQEASPAMKEAGVFLDGDSLHALVVLDRDAVPTPDSTEASAWTRREVLAPYNARVAPYRRVSRVTLVNDDLPRTRLGKLKRHRLPAIAASLTPPEPDSAEAAGRDDPVLARLREHLSRQARRPVHARSLLDADVGLDSLGRVELAVFIEQAFGLTIPDATLAEIETVGELARFVAERAAARDATPSHVGWSDMLAPAQASSLPTSGIWHRALVYLSRLLVRTLFRARAQGADRLPAEACIIAPNHQSFIDGLFVTAFMRPRSVLRTLFYAKEKHVRMGWLRYLAERCNVIVMKADQGILPSLQKLAAGLRRGNHVMIFPEGTRSIGGALGDFKESYAVLARELRVPVVPVVIDGAHRVLPAGGWLPRLYGKVSVTYLEPIWPREDEEPSRLNERVRAVVEEVLEAGRARIVGLRRSF
jgi:long-chain acyl-CoA synthetase